MKQKNQDECLEAILNLLDPFGLKVTNKFIRGSYRQSSNYTRLALITREKYDFCRACDYSKSMGGGIYCTNQNLLELIEEIDKIPPGFTIYITDMGLISDDY